MSPNNVLSFPPFRFDIPNQRLYYDSEYIPLRAKTSAVLRYLLEHPGQLVKKNDLLDAVWADTAVGDAVLKVSIRELREALQDDPKEPRFIETAHRFGYRFIAEIRTTNTPLPLTSFIGREPEVAEIKRLLQGTRLLTVVGSGGSGKTRLAIRVANDLSNQSGDEVWWIDLSSMLDGSLLPQAVASVLSIREQPERTPVQVLCEVLRQKQLILVLNNCEHLIRACAEFMDTLLHACAKLTIVATSREIIGIKGEVVFQVSPLSLPKPGSAMSAREAMIFEGVCLFVDRAVATAPDFCLTDDNVATVMHVCQRLDGIPLAIELAASRIRILTIEQLSARLDDSLRLLTGSIRTVAPRQQTLRAAIEWSYQLLDDEEQMLLRRISVFTGEWTLDMAEDICAFGQIATGDVLDILSRLIDKSLVGRVEAHVRAAFRLLETIRQYAKEKLVESGEALTLNQRHAAFFVRWAKSIAPIINTAEREQSLSSLESQNDNLRTAVQYLSDTDDTAAELRLCEALFFFWFYRGHWTEGRRRLEEALTRSTNHPENTLRANVMTGAGMLANIVGDHLTAQLRLEKSIDIHREHGNTRYLANALVFLAYEIATTDLSRARALAEEGVSILREDDNKFFLAMSLNHLGAIAFIQRDQSVAQKSYEEAVALSLELNDEFALGTSLRGLGALSMRENDYELAKLHLTKSLLALRNKKEKWFTSRTFDTLAQLYSAEKDYERAACLFGAASTTREMLGASLYEFYRDEYERHFEATRDALGAERFSSLWAEGRAMTVDQAVAYVLDE